MSENTPVLAVSGLCAGYRSTVISDITFSLRPGEILCVAGESGCGKSTLLKALMGVDDAVHITAGEIRLLGQSLSALPVRERQRFCCARMGMIFQNPGASFDPIRPYGAQFRETLKSHGKYRKARFAADAAAAFAKLGLTDSARILASRPYELSGGMNQRAAMALALLLEQRILLSDEPTSALDAAVRLQAARELKKLSREDGIAQIVVTHDLALARFLSDSIAVLHGGRFVEYGDTETVLHAPGHPYTKELLQAVPRLECSEGACP